MTTTTKVEVSPESARKALKRAQDLLHVWAPLVRAIARNQKLKVQLTGGAPCTDGETVFLRVPIELAFTDHEKELCGKWDESTNQFFCPACRVEMDCDMALFHEVSHMLAGSFSHDDPDAELIALLTEAWPTVGWDLRALSIGGYAKKSKANTLISRLVTEFPDQWGFFVFNVVEDVYVNDSIMTARKGLVTIFESFYETIMKEGILNKDGSRTVFSELHPFIQACSAWSLIASGQSSVTRYLDSDVVAAVKGSKVLMDLASDIATTHSIVERFKVAVRLLLELERIGFIAREPAPEESPGEGEPDEDGDPSEGEGESGESGDGDGEAEGDPDGEPREGDKPKGGVKVDTDDTDGAPEDSDDDSDDEDDAEGGAGSESKNDEDDESDSEGSGSGGTDDESDESDESDEDSSDTSEGDEMSDGADTHGESSEVSEDGDSESGDSDGDSDGTTSESEAAPSDGKSSLEESGGGEIDHDAESDEGDSEGVELPTIEEARAAFETLTGHEGFGDSDDLEAALSDIEEPTTPEERKATELVESALSFDGVLDNIDNNLLRAIVDGEATTRYSGALIGSTGSTTAYELPTEVMAPAVQRMRLAFAANRKIGNVRGLTSGPKLDAKTLGYRIPTGDDRIFARREIPKKRNWTVLIGIDVSGSTASGGALETEKKVAIGIGDLLTQIGIPFSMYAHTGEGAAGGKYNLIICPIKTEHQLWKGDGRDRARRLKSGSANLDGHTMQAYRKLLERQKGKDKLLLYFTDGAMPCENGREEREVLEHECALLKRKGIYTVGVGIGCDDPRRYGLDTIEVNSTRDIPGLLAGIGQRLSR